MLRFWPPIKKNYKFDLFRPKIAKKTPRVPKKGHNRNFCKDKGSKGIFPFVGQK